MCYLEIFYFKLQFTSRNCLKYLSMIYLILLFFFSDEPDRERDTKFGDTDRIG